MSEVSLTGLGAPPPAQSSMPALRVSLDGALLTVNDALCELLERDRDELLGSRISDLAAFPTDARRGRRALAAARAGAACGDFTQRWSRGDGADLRLVRLAWTLVVARLGEPAYLSVFCMDESPRSQDAHSDTSDQPATSLEESAVAQLVFDLDGALTEPNAAFLRMVGASRAELVGRPIADLFHETDTRAGDVQLAVLRAGRIGSAQFEAVLARTDGRPVPVLVHAWVVRDDAAAQTGVAMWLQDLDGIRSAERRQERQEDFFLALAQRAGELALVADTTGLVVYTSSALMALIGVTPEEAAQLEITELVHPDDAARARAAFTRSVSTGTTETTTTRVRNSVGDWHWVELTSSNVLDTAVGGMLCNLRDIHDRVQVETALRSSESRYRAIADNADEGLWVANRDGRTTYVNNRMVEILGIGADEIYERSLLEVLDPLGRLDTVSLTDATSEESARYETTYPHPDGRRRILKVAACQLREPTTPDGFLAMISDVTDARRLEDELRRAALNDTLTGLPNRALAIDRIDHALTRRTTTTAVVFVDLDRFRVVNDARGHSAGDELLVQVAARLRGVSPQQHTVARFGGDEFVVVCEDVDEEGATLVARALLDTFALPLQISGGEVHLTASIGVALSPASASEVLLRQAAAAVGAAKTAGRNRITLFDDSLAARVEERYDLGGDLRRAMTDGQMTLHHQPILDLSTGRVVGSEALARWTHPVHGPVSPERFVAIAEEIGLAPELDRWALSQALEDVRAMRAAGALGPDSYVAVNFSARTLSEPGLDVWVADTVLDAGFAPHEVVLEVTESAIMADTPRAVALLTNLRWMGFQIAVDDFGTGHSSLAYLRNLPLTMLKIDRSFVPELVTDPRAMSIASSIIQLARALDLTVVAEGVETEEHAAVLRELGCRAAQGWLWSPAVSTQEARRSGALVRRYPAPAEVTS